MARIRSLKPEFCASPSIAALSIPCRLHFAMLWTHADDEGRGLDNPLLIKAALWPLDEDISAADVETWQAELARNGRIIRYEVEGKSCFQIVNFLEHQHPSHPRPSIFPPPSVNVHGDVPDDSVNGHGAFQPVDNESVSHTEKVQVQLLTEPSVNVHGSLLAVVGAGAGAGGGEGEGAGAGARPAETPPEPRKVFAAAVELLLLRLDKAGVAATKNNPTSWMDSARRGLKADHHDRAIELLAKDPAITPEELADALVPPIPEAPKPASHRPYVADRDRPDEVFEP